jgi:hypothetical protein
MSIVDHLRRAVERTQGRLPALRSGVERFSVSVAVPGGRLGNLGSVQIEVCREPHEDGERIRIHARFEARLASVLRPMITASSDAQRQPGEARPALAPPARARAGRPLHPLRDAQRLAGRTLQRVLATEPARRLTEPLLGYDLSTHIDIHASTASLDAGPRALLPPQERLAELGIRPSPLANGALAESWSGQSGNRYTEIALLQLDKRALPADLRRHFGDRPFQLVAAMLNTLHKIESDDKR